ncbi:hypothetical protein Alo02nite_09800 [Actinoplanes lobatus]|uniref:Uncharacterized protein n=1 Tax=Actinoplanes lobatus TaxID=113568 RepID=A0ABQ4AAR0_9ACTN|nr:hypothetical protein Alo02nite_09800 [Actinoplanes lobatus]
MISRVVEAGAALSPEAVGSASEEQAPRAAATVAAARSAPMRWVKRDIMNSRGAVGIRRLGRAEFLSHEVRLT